MSNENGSNLMESVRNKNFADSLEQKNKIKRI
jgi:hypothetical protein